MAAKVPRWITDLTRLLAIRSQFIVSGNIRDSFVLSLPECPTLIPFLRTVWEALKSQGITCLLVYDPVSGIRVYPDEAQRREHAGQLFDLKLSAGSQLISLERLSDLMQRLSTERSTRCALLVDFASRITRQTDHPGEMEHRFFVTAEKLSLQASPVISASGGKPLFNPILWLVNRPQDLPSWFALDSERIASLIIPQPDFETRMAAAGQLAPLFNGHEQASEAEREKFIQHFAASTEGMSLNALADITELACRQNLGIGSIDDAVRCFKIGVLDNPWRRDYLRQRIRDGAVFIEGRVKGQHRAITKTLDILKRSVMGLTGAQASAASGRPRGVLFFAGPTGVGKTELAKTLTQLVFGNERAYIRFDMSEFAEEHTSARLLGAPPGYIGFDAGGELTNAVREKPFSVVLFDEIEKAHPRILDKFLQILEDGRLTDGRGDTAYFSETILIFTSNLGIYTENEQGQRIQNVRPGDAYDQVETRVRGAIGDYFKYRLSRPEILNRIGDNIVVFDFISAETGERIFDSMLHNVERRMTEEFGLHLVVPAEIRCALLTRCLKDLSNGGRGIGNALESCFINPLSRALFEHELDGCRKVLVTSLEESDTIVSLSIRTDKNG